MHTLEENQKTFWGGSRRSDNVFIIIIWIKQKDKTICLIILQMIRQAGQIINIVEVFAILEAPILIKK